MPLLDRQPGPAYRLLLAQKVMAMAGKARRLLRRFMPPPEILLLIITGAFFGNQNQMAGQDGGGLLVVCADNEGCGWGDFFPGHAPRRCPLCHLSAPRHVVKSALVNIRCVAPVTPRCPKRVAAHYVPNRTTPASFVCSLPHVGILR